MMEIMGSFDSNLFWSASQLYQKRTKSFGLGLNAQERMGSMNINDNRPRDGQGPQGKDNSQNTCAAFEANDMNISEKSNLLMDSSMPTLDNKMHNVDTPFGSSNSASSKGGYMGEKGSSVFEEDPYCDNLIMDAVDLSIENYEVLFGDSLNYPDELFENENLDCFFGMKDVKNADSSCRDANAAEGSSMARVNTVQPTCSDAASADSVMSCKTDSILYFARQSSLSVSNQTGGECSAGDHQDCGVSPMLLIGEPPWCPPCPEISSPSTSRSNAVLRYKEKKKTRKFDKRVRYVSRKARADVRRQAIDGYHVVSEQQSLKQIRRASFCQLKNAAEKQEFAISGAHNQPSLQRVIKIHLMYAGFSLLLFLQLQLVGFTHLKYS
ncbi:hypothetical protein K7X08_015329 [Anisodus acutangulus]|uniref:CCT domain-containing protein n=1 Tax=Anisodus acutangulus TaxID=402998 RepID=A0A9Q1QUF8_9SOLA|nr:hypothetical protein K7X08_015329 [Anisodus acutangulus]